MESSVALSAPPLKTEALRFRLTKAQKKELVDAASSMGMSVSAWVLSCGLREARGLRKDFDGLVEEE